MNCDYCGCHYNCDPLTYLWCNCHCHAYLRWDTE